MTRNNSVTSDSYNSRTLAFDTGRLLNELDFWWEQGWYGASVRAMQCCIETAVQLCLHSSRFLNPWSCMQMNAALEWLKRCRDCVENPSQEAAESRSADLQSLAADLSPFYFATAAEVDNYLGQASLESSSQFRDVRLALFSSSATNEQRHFTYLLGEAADRIVRPSNIRSRLFRLKDNQDFATFATARCLEFYLYEPGEIEPDLLNIDLVRKYCDRLEIGDALPSSFNWTTSKNLSPETRCRSNQSIVTRIRQRLIEGETQLSDQQDEASNVQDTADGQPIDEETDRDVRSQHPVVEAAEAEPLTPIPRVNVAVAANDKVLGETADDPTAYVRAIQLDKGQFASRRKFDSVMKGNPKIRRMYRGKHLYVHAGDWHHFKTRPAGNPLDLPAVIVDAVLETQQRKAEIDAHQQARKKRPRD